MKARALILGVLALTGACKKSGGGGGGGGGTTWLVGASGMMLRIGTDGALAGYSAPSSENLNAIACRYGGEAWVAGAHGTLLYTADGGRSWAVQPVPTRAELRAVATQDLGPVYLAGDGVVLRSTDTGAHWTQLADGARRFRSIAAAQHADTVIAVADDGGLWAVEDRADGPALVAGAQLAGARAVAVSPDGQTVVVAGDALLARSADAGHTFTRLDAPAGVRFDDVRIDDAGAAIAVGSAGAIARIGADGAVAVHRVGNADLHTLHIAEPGEDGDARGFAGGEGGAVWITDDGGASWHAGPDAGQTVLGLDQIGDGHR